MKKLSIFVTIIALFVCATVSAETYTWWPQVGYAWDTNLVWNSAIPANSNKFPDAIDDVAINNTLTVTNASGFYQIWPNQFDSRVFTTIGEWYLNMSNSLIFGTGPDPNGMVFVKSDPNSTAKWHFTNLYINESEPNWWWNHTLDLRFDTMYILSNDLNIKLEGPVDSYGDKDSAVMWFVDDINVFGNGHSITKEGEGRMIVGAFYSDTLEYSNPSFNNAPLYIQDGSFEPNHGATFTEPVYLSNGNGYYRQHSAEDVDVDLVFDGGYYVANYTSLLNNTNHGDFSVLEQADFLMSTYGGNIHHLVHDGDIQGTNWVAEWWDGDILFAGSISPGIGTNVPLAQLSFYSKETNSIRIGASDRPVDLNIDIDGANSDILALDSLLDVALSNVNLNLNVSNPNPDDTNLIVYSFDTGIDIGQFRSITINPSNFAGTIIYYLNAVEVTGLQAPGEFTINTNWLEYVTGETQKFVTLTTPYMATVTNVVVDGTNWITVPALTVIPSNSVDVPITIPFDQPDGSTGLVRFTSIEMPTKTYDVMITVVPEATTLAIVLFACIFSLYKRN